MAALPMFSYVMSFFPGGVRTPRRPQSAVNTRQTTRKSSAQSNLSFRTASETSTSSKVEEDGPSRPNGVTITDLESQPTSGTGATMVNQSTSSSKPKQSLSFTSRLQARLKPSDRTIYTAILGTSDGMTVPFAVMASLAGVSDARLVMLAGLAELIAGAISMGAGGILGAKCDEERHQAEIRCTTRLVDTHPNEAVECLAGSLSEDLPITITDDIIKYYQSLDTAGKAALILRFHQDPDPCPIDTYKAAATFFLTYFSGLPALIPYIVVRADQVSLAFYISIGITTLLSFAYGWAKTGYNVGWAGWADAKRCIWGGLTFFGVVAAASAASVLIIRGIDHNL